MNDGALLDLDCGISCMRITAWLDAEPAFAREQDAWLFGKGEDACRIEATPLASREVGPVTLERTHLVARGSEAAVAAFRRAFTLRFLSAGG